MSSLRRFLCPLMILTATLGVLAGCSTILPEVLPPVQDTSLISDRACLPPCWHGIVPGETGVNQALTTLKSLSFVDVNSITSDDRVPAGYEPYLRWSYRGATMERHGGVMDIRNDIVASQIVHLPRCLKLGDIVVNHGVPNLFRAERDPESTNTWFEFFYPTSGLMLYGRFPQDGKDEGVIFPETCIFRADYFSPDELAGYLRNVRYFLSDDSALEGFVNEYHPWPGMNQSVSLAGQ